MLGRYRLDAVIGRGGMGVVFRAVDERLDRTVAIKVLAPDIAGDPLVQERFLREARLASSIEHPHIVPVLEAASAGGVDYIAMRYVPGSDLGRLLRREAPLRGTRTLAIIEQVADALDAAHARGLVHRDVKPSNVLLEDRGGEWAWLSDFGLTKRMDGSVQLTREGLVGTLEYIAPEAIEHGTLDGRSDQYALGCVAYHCLSGRPPFVAQSEAQLLHAHLHDTPPPIAGSETPPSGIDEVIRRALAKRQADRFPSCRAFATELRRAIEAAPVAAAVGAGLGTATGRPADPTAPARSGRSLPSLATRRKSIVGAMVLAGAVGGSLYLVGQPRQDLGALALLPSSSPPASGVPTGAPSDPAAVADTAHPTASPAATQTPVPTDPEASTRPTSGATLAATPAPAPTEPQTSSEPSPRAAPGATPAAASLTGPDGVIVFAGKTGRRYDIWAMRPDGSGLTQITDTPDVDERSPSVSADGSRIVYDRGAARDREIWLIDRAGGGRPQQLTTDAADDFTPSISPDGRHIAWVSNRSDPRFDHVWLMTDEGDGFQGQEARATDLTNERLTAGNHSRAPAWFPDSRRIAFQSNDRDSPDIWHVTLGGARTWWTRDRRLEFQPTVGPDDTIVFIRQPLPLDTTRFLYRVTEPQGRLRRVSELQDPKDVDFSPDGERLVVARGANELITMGADGDGRRAVPIGDMRLATDPDWVESVFVPPAPR
jgi:serine/threonine-protein kinase